MLNKVIKALAEIVGGDPLLFPQDYDVTGLNVPPISIVAGHAKIGTTARSSHALR